MGRRKTVTGSYSEDAKVKRSAANKSSSLLCVSSPVEPAHRQHGCLHIPSSVVLQRDDLIVSQKAICIVCSGGSKAHWLCLHCLDTASATVPYATFCGAKEHNHVNSHFEETRHSVYVNPINSRLFCMECDSEINKDTNIPALPIELKRSLLSLKRIRKLSGSKNHVSPDSKAKKEADGNHNTKSLQVQIREPSKGELIDKTLLGSRPFVKFIDDVFEDDFPKGLTGLDNLGNTCYFNAAIQVLSNCPQFSDYFREKDNIHVYAVKEPVVATRMAQLIQQIWSSKRYSSVSPRELLTSLRNAFTQFQGYHQQDSQELMRCLLEAIHRELAQPLYVYENSPLVAPSERRSSDSSSDSERFETADSGLSSDGESPSTSTNDRSKISLMDEKMAQFNPPKIARWRSIVSDVFDGTIESNVTCLTCKSVSSTTESFQDLSLPIPTKDHPSRKLEEEDSLMQKDSSWISWWNWISGFSSVFITPGYSLDDCFRAFFSPDRLDGDDMYSCEKCKKLRNGVKTCKIKEPPELLSIHIKRFRHDTFSSSKINSRVEFPLVDLDISSYCVDGVSCLYDLCGFVTHAGHGSDSGHYIAYCRNEIDGNWYEFDDCTVTKLDSAYVLTKEAYVLFYQKKSSPEVDAVRVAVSNMVTPEATVKNCLDSTVYISTEWLDKLNTFADPGPINNYAFLCEHRNVIPRKAANISNFCVAISKDMASLLYRSFGGGPRVNALHRCLVCDRRWKWLLNKKEKERDFYKKKSDEVRNLSYSCPSAVYSSHLPISLMSKTWFQKWERFLSDPFAEPPGPVDNGSILSKNHDGQPIFNSRSFYIMLPREIYVYFQQRYQGGPEVLYFEGTQPEPDKLAQMIKEADEAIALAKQEHENRMNSQL